MTARVEAGPRVCEGCGAGFERRRFPNGRLEELARFVDRRFCSRDCYRQSAAAGGVQRQPGVWIHGPHQPTAVESVADGSDMRGATGRGYPWERKQAPRPVPIPGPFQAERQTYFTTVAEESRS